MYQVGSWPLFSGISGIGLLWGGVCGCCLMLGKGWLLEGWQWFFVITSFPFVVALVSAHYFVYESPRYHDGVGNHKEARNGIVEMYAKSGKIRPMELTVVNWCSSSGSGGESSGNRQSLNERGGGVPSSSSSSSSSSYSSSSSSLLSSFCLTSSWCQLCCSSESLSLFAVWI